MLLSLKTRVPPDHFNDPWYFLLKATGLKSFPVQQKMLFTFSQLSPSTLVLKVRPRGPLMLPQGSLKIPQMGQKKDRKWRWVCQKEADYCFQMEVKQKPVKYIYGIKIQNKQAA